MLDIQSLHMSNSDFNFDGVQEFFEEQGWNITDTFESDDVATWSVTARTEEDTRISIDEPTASVDMNNIIVETDSFVIEDISEYDSAFDVADDYELVWVQSSSSNGEIQRATASVDVEMTEREIVEKLIENESGIFLRFIITESSKDTSLEDVIDFVDSIESAKQVFSGFYKTT